VSDNALNCVLQDDFCFLESEILLANNKVGKLEASNKHMHAELATLRNQLKTAQEAQKVAEDALAANEAQVVQMVEIATKLLEDNLNAISTSIKEFNVDIFGKSPVVLKKNP
jgi:chromosome segregation ATPase